MVEVGKTQRRHALIVGIATGLLTGILFPSVLVCGLMATGKIPLNGAWGLFAFGKRVLCPEFVVPAILMSLIGATSATVGPVSGPFRFWPECLILLLTPVVFAVMPWSGLFAKEGAMLLVFALANTVMAGWIACRTARSRLTRRSQGGS